ncbi:conserved protein of unknown function [Candidatus Promineifilum breve]|uniref:N-methyl-D-aspartate receptor NMDAR2C subunit n=1 Tax=Candidatus Promineifilum breve TaxID=1806508 RepID=A0A160T1H0_9CHLR|nr:N-methyl-D-aspartate receptor NMDAR2C subunit [Candidatus Promineifilum breve]CUS02658.2 conserved protein of unknown function [Candidatus Promineifilum breve]
MIDPNVLLGRWRTVWRLTTAADGDAVILDLIARYAEPHRAYHNLDHIGDCLTHLDAARHLLARPNEVELAIWFHDAIYDPQRHDNEEQSALLVAAQLSAARVAAEVTARVAELIRLTAHTRDDLAGDAAVLCDIDLAILGAAPQRFERYDAAIRHEYEWVPEVIYRRERARVLAGFLERPRIYQTPFFFDRWEKQARANITVALQKYHS